MGYGAETQQKFTYPLSVGDGYCALEYNKPVTLIRKEKPRMVGGVFTLVFPPGKQIQQYDELPS